jgi:hypothetical protein
MKANQRQVGGAHYKTRYEHWDLIIECCGGYLEGCATKHVSRWRKKLGKEDLEKAGHYLQKLIEAVQEHGIEWFKPRIMNRMFITDEVDKFVIENGLTNLEGRFILTLLTYKEIEDLRMAGIMLEEIIEEADAEKFIPGTPEDGGHHAKGGMAPG